MGLYLVSDSFYAKIPIDDPEEKLCVFCQHIIDEQNLLKKEGMIEELLAESRSRIQHIPASASAHFGLGISLIYNDNPGGYAFIDRAITLSGPSIEYIVYTLQFLMDAGIDHETFAIPRIHSYIDRLIEKVPYHDGAMELAERFTKMTEYEDFERKLAFAKQRLRFQR